MRRSAYLLIALLSLPAAAHAHDYLDAAFESALIPSKYVLIFDQCVREGYIEGHPANAEKQLRVLFNKAKRASEPQRPPEVTGEEVASAGTQALDTLKAKLVAEPITLNLEECEMLKKAWPDYARQFGFK